jgi:putative toxin-antitoxin system antitoxin component (TIGR02293 family)
MATLLTDRLSPDLAEFTARSRSAKRSGHYYAALLGLRRYDAPYVAEQVQRGLAFTAFERFVRNTALSAPELAQLIAVPPRTLARRRVAGRLGPDEADRLARLARVFARAVELFEGDVEGALRWLRRPARALGLVAPLTLASTDAGALEVESLIGRLEHGLPA